MQNCELLIGPASNGCRQWCGLDSTNLYRLSSTSKGVKSVFNIVSYSYNKNFIFTLGYEWVHRFQGEDQL